MTQEVFVTVVRRQVFDAAVSEKVLQPHGRQPHQVLVQRLPKPALSRSMEVPMSADPWAGYDQIALAEREGLSAGHLRLLAVGSLRTELNNGGFDQYFSTQQAIWHLSLWGRPKRREPLSLLLSSVKPWNSSTSLTPRTERRAKRPCGG
jgi:hypothetical protein